MVLPLALTLGDFQLPRALLVILSGLVSIAERSFFMLIIWILGSQISQTVDQIAVMSPIHRSAEMSFPPFCWTWGGDSIILFPTLTWMTVPGGWILDAVDLPCIVCCTIAALHLGAHSFTLSQSDVPYGIKILISYGSDPYQTIVLSQLGVLLSFAACVSVTPPFTLDKECTWYRSGAFYFLWMFLCYSLAPILPSIQCKILVYVKEGTYLPEVYFQYRKVITTLFSNCFSKVVCKHEGWCKELFYI